MTARELKITKAVLGYLHLLDGGQAVELQIHLGCAQFFLPPEPATSVAELRCVLADMDAKRWITGVPSKLTGKMKWNLSDAGAAARLELASE